MSWHPWGQTALVVLVLVAVAVNWIMVHREVKRHEQYEADIDALIAVVFGRPDELDVRKTQQRAEIDIRTDILRIMQHLTDNEAPSLGRHAS